MVFKTLEWNDGDKNDHEKILEKFEDYISPKKNKRVAPCTHGVLPH